MFLCRRLVSRGKFRRHLRQIGFQKRSDGTLSISGNGKEVVRALHGYQRNDRLEKNRDFLINRAPKLLEFFASGSDIQPKYISPVLEKIDAGTWQAELFRLASLTWSVPVSNGFGRRLRYLVWDNNNRKLIGLIAIGDPVFNLAVRDNLIGWDARDRSAPFSEHHGCICARCCSAVQSSTSGENGGMPDSNTGNFRGLSAHVR